MTEEIIWHPPTEKPPSLETKLLRVCDPHGVDVGEWNDEEKYWQYGVDEWTAEENGEAIILGWADMPKGPDTILADNAE